MKQMKPSRNRLKKIRIKQRNKKKNNNKNNKKQKRKKQTNKQTKNKYTIETSSKKKKVLSSKES